MDKNEKDTRYPNRFKVVDGISNQFTEISADSPSQMNEWVDAINMVCKSYGHCVNERMLNVVILCIEKFVISFLP